MILVLEDVPGISPADLLARVSKATGAPGVRGPLVDKDAAAHPLSQLREGDKLHIVGSSNGAQLAGSSPEGLLALLESLGWSRAIRLKQIHLIAGSAGNGGDASFAALFEAAIRSRGFQVDEIKAPLGPVRCDTRGKIWVYSGSHRDWEPSSPALNYYVGPRVAEKHR
jgi:hypothetical protein